MSRWRGFVVIVVRFHDLQVQGQNIQKTRSRQSMNQLRSERQPNGVARRRRSWESPLSEFASLLARPALDHDFRLGEEFDGITSLTVKNAEETLLPATEREIRHRRGNTDVNADVTCGRLVTEFAGSRPARGKKRGLISIRTATEEFHGFVHGIGVNQAEHRAKDFGVRKLAGGRETIQNRGGQEIACLISENSRAASIHNGLRTFPDTGVNQTFDAPLTFFANDR